MGGLADKDHSARAPANLRWRADITALQQARNWQVPQGAPTVSGQQFGASDGQSPFVWHATDVQSEGPQETSLPSVQQLDELLQSTRPSHRALRPGHESAAGMQRGAFSPSTQQRCAGVHVPPAPHTMPSCVVAERWQISPAQVSPWGHAWLVSHLKWVSTGGSS
jgi:hypothetical protein